jgi:hypothetical protein
VDVLKVVKINFKFRCYSRKYCNGRESRFIFGRKWADGVKVGMVWFIVLQEVVAGGSRFLQF